MRHLLRTTLLRLVARYHRSKPLQPSLTTATPSQPRQGVRILVIRPDHLGDVLFLTPALRRLRSALPDAEITVLVGPWAEDLLTMNPDVDHVETLPFPWFDRRPKANALAPYRLLYQCAHHFRGRFDVAVIARFDHDWGAWLAAAAGIPTIIGYDTPTVAPFLTQRVPYVANRHEVLQNTTLIERVINFYRPNHSSSTNEPLHSPLSTLRYEITGVHRLKVRQLLNGSGLQKADGPLVAIHPGSGAAVKRWDVEKWAELIRELRTRYGYQFVVTGGSAEVLLASKVVRAVGEGVPIVSVADDTTLPELAALFEQCALVIGPDSGPLHVAVAMNRPTVHLYGPVSPQTFGPWGDPKQHLVVTQSLACQYCHRLDWAESELPDHPCVSGISVARVLTACQQLLG
jgi:lipopolysaccharide heptosyltransferase II